MENDEYFDISENKLRTLKVWRIIIVIYGLFVFIAGPLLIVLIFNGPGGVSSFVEELFFEMSRYPVAIIQYLLLFIIVFAFSLPRLILLNKFGKAIILGKRTLYYEIVYLVYILAVAAVLFVVLPPYLSRARKPIIYLYPEKRTEVNVKLEIDGKLVTTYPSYDEEKGWTVTASPDGTLTGRNGRKYNYLYWEGDISIKPDLSQGYCVKGEDTAKFLEAILGKLGLTDKEADDFITFWLPEMSGNKYNVISFQTTTYEDVASLKVSPKPDTIIRVNMLWYASNSYVDIKPQDLKSVNPSERKGFTVVEWGGEEYKKGVFQSLFK